MENESHQCHFCGTFVRNGVESGGARHWLSDCRPDLVAHEPGETCTWGYRLAENPDLPKKDVCYAYNDEDEHVKFYPDGPM